MTASMWWGGIGVENRASLLLTTNAEVVKRIYRVRWGLDDICTRQRRAAGVAEHPRGHLHG